MITLPTLHTIDYIMLIPLAYGLIRGILNGLFIELASLLAFWLGITVAWKCSHLLQGYLVQHISVEESVLPFLAFFILFVAVSVGVILLGRLLNKLAELIQIGWLNKLMGGLFGMLKFVLIEGVLLFALHYGNLLPYNRYAPSENSLLYEPIYSLTALLWPMLQSLISTPI